LIETTRGFVRVDGDDLEFVRHSPVEGRQDSLSPFVMLHEGLGSIALWKKFPEELAEYFGRDVIAYSRKGYGQSTPISQSRDVDYMHREAQEILPAVLDHLDVTSPILLGHSDGASIALIFSGSGHIANGLIVMAPHVFVETLTVRSIEGAKKTFENTDLRSRLSKYHGDVDSAFWGWNDIWLSKEFLKWNIEDYVTKIQSPILVVQSSDDPYGTLAQVDAIEKLSSGKTARAILEDCGHSPHVDQKQKTIDAIERFVLSLT